MLGSVAYDHKPHDTLEWMKQHRVQDVQTNIKRLWIGVGRMTRGVLLNVTPATWEEHRGEEITGPDSLGENELQQFASELFSEVEVFHIETGPGYA